MQENFNTITTPEEAAKPKPLPITRKQFKRLLYLQKREIRLARELAIRKAHNRKRNKQARKSRQLNRLLKHGK